MFGGSSARRNLLFGRLKKEVSHCENHLWIFVRYINFHQPININILYQLTAIQLHFVLTFGGPHPVRRDCLIHLIFI